MDTYSVWVMNSDGSENTQLTHNPLNRAWPTWSPDGTQIAFSSYSGNPRALHVHLMHPDGSDLRAVTSGAAEDFFPTWAPDGTILFLRNQTPDSHSGDVWAVRPDGSELVQLTTGWNVGNYALSPDGTKMAIHDTKNHRIVILHMDASRSSATLVEGDFRSVVVALAWSPDGQAVAMATSNFDSPTGSDVYIVNADGSGSTTVPNAGSSWDPTRQP